MPRNKTADGIRISRVVESLETVPGIELRDGKDDRVIATMTGYDRVCPIGTGTNVRKSVVSWLRYATGTSKGAAEIYDMLRTGGEYATVP
tara:strand:- start:1166 stop:1435 length:270 start_codon:yes stop_codon:yes gene_type:complete